MTKLSDKTIITQSFSGATSSIPTSFNKGEVDATVRDKSYAAIFEKAYLCPCKSKSSTSLNTCKNCGGTGWIFCNPTQTGFIITGIAHDNKLKEAALREWGNMDLGSVNVTAINDDKLSFMDRITLIDATTEHNQIIYPSLTDDEVTAFVFTKYNILSIDNITLFIDENTELKRLIEGEDYTFGDNVINFTADSGVDGNSQISIRYIHRPVFHITDIVRESMTSKIGELNQGQQTLILPIKAIAKRAHLIDDIENYDGDRLLDNSWLPSACETEEITAFVRQLRYATAQQIFDNLTNKQKQDLAILLGGGQSYIKYNNALIATLQSGETLNITSDFGFTDFYVTNI